MVRIFLVILCYPHCIPMVMIITTLLMILVIPMVKSLCFTKIFPAGGCALGFYKLLEQWLPKRPLPGPEESLGCRELEKMLGFTMKNGLHGETWWFNMV